MGCGACAGAASKALATILTYPAIRAKVLLQVRGLRVVIIAAPSSAEATPADTHTRAHTPHTTPHLSLSLLRDFCATRTHSAPRLPCASPLIAPYPRLSCHCPLRGRVPPADGSVAINGGGGHYTRGSVG